MKITTLQQEIALWIGGVTLAVSIYYWLHKLIHWVPQRAVGDAFMGMVLASTLMCVIPIVIITGLFFFSFRKR